MKISFSPASIAIDKVRLQEIKFYLWYIEFLFFKMV